MEKYHVRDIINQNAPKRRPRKAKKKIKKMFPFKDMLVFSPEILTAKINVSKWY